VKAHRGPVGTPFENLLLKDLDADWATDPSLIEIAE
jgi:hypothetical protein